MHSGVNSAGAIGIKQPNQRNILYQSVITSVVVSKVVAMLLPVLS